MRAGGAAQGGLGDVDAQAGGARQGVEDAGEVVAGARTRVEDQAVARAYRPGQRGRDEVVVARRQEGLAVRDHLDRVARMGRPARREVHVALPRDVEAVPAWAAQAPIGPVQRLAAHRTPQVRQCSVDHSVLPTSIW
nr:hypothetical protein GCM10020092_010750 [Actinoplanes digitatis]